MTIAALVEQYLRAAAVYYRRPDGSPTREALNLRSSLDWLVVAAGDCPVHDLTRAHVKDMRVRMMMGTPPRSRGYINKVVGHVRRLVRWAADEDLCPPAVLAEVERVRPLLPGRSPARETTPRGAVNPRHVEAVLPHLPPTAAVVVRLLCLTGSRLGQLLRLTSAEINTDDPAVWWAIPTHHKTSHRGRRLTIPLDARGIALVEPLLTPLAPDNPLFPSPIDRTRPYRRDSIARAIQRACDAAGVPRWTPHQIRRRVALDVRRRAGLDAAQALLGHADVKTTELYAPVGDAEAAGALAAVPGLFDGRADGGDA